MFVMRLDPLTSLKCLVSSTSPKVTYYRDIALSIGEAPVEPSAQFLAGREAVASAAPVRIALFELHVKSSELSTLSAVELVRCERPSNHNACFESAIFFLAAETEKTNLYSMK